MSEEYGNNFVVLTDENGKEVELEHLDTVEYNGQTYMAFIPAEMDVLFALLFCAAVVIWGMRQAANGVDSAAIIDSALRVFGTELGICGIMTMFKRWTEAQDRRLEESRQRAEERRRKREERRTQNE